MRRRSGRGRPARRFGGQGGCPPPGAPLAARKPCVDADFARLAGVRGGAGAGAGLLRRRNASGPRVWRERHPARPSGISSARGVGASACAGSSAALVDERERSQHGRGATGMWSTGSKAVRPPRDFCGDGSIPGVIPIHRFFPGTGARDGHLRTARPAPPAPRDPQRSRSTRARRGRADRLLPDCPGRPPSRLGRLLQCAFAAAGVASPRHSLRRGDGSAGGGGGHPRAHPARNARQRRRLAARGDAGGRRTCIAGCPARPRLRGCTPSDEP